MALSWDPALIRSAQAHAGGRGTKQLQRRADHGDTLIRDAGRRGDEAIADQIGRVGCVNLIWPHLLL